MEKKRSISLDLLRIISMLMVVCIHYFGNGGLIPSTLELWSPNWFWSTSFDAMCHVCVDCFVLISGYFLCTATFRLEKWVAVWLTATFYSAGIYVILAAAGIVPWALTDLIKSGMTLTLQPYWFVTPYLLMYAISPFMNHAIRAMTKKQHLMCCFVLLGLFSVLPNIIYISDFTGINGGFHVLWFCVLYMVAAYIRKHVPTDAVKTGHAAIAFLICILVIVVQICLAHWLTPKLLGRTVLTTLFLSYNSIPLAFGSIFLLLTFRGIELRGKLWTKLIGFAAPVSFSVYLISHHPILKQYLWDWLSPRSYATSPWLIVHMVICVGTIFLVCCLTDHLRRWLFKLCRIDACVSKVCHWLTDKTEMILDKLT